MIKFVAKIQSKDNYYYFETVDWNTKACIDKLIEKLKDNNFYASITIDKPFRKRSTGIGSQNHHINGHIQQICQETGNEFETVKDYCKGLAVNRGYPFETFQGQIFPKSESKISVEEAGILLETIHQLASELNIKLIENEESKNE